MYPCELLIFVNLWSVAACTLVNYCYLYPCGVLWHVAEECRSTQVSFWGWWLFAVSHGLGQTTVSKKSSVLYGMTVTDRSLGNWLQKTFHSATESMIQVVLQGRKAVVQFQPTGFLLLCCPFVYRVCFFPRVVCVCCVCAC